MKKTPIADAINELLESKPIFKNRDVLRSTYVPDYLPHRDNEVDALLKILIVALRGDTPSNILIYGKTGTGKTAVTTHVGKEIEKAGSARGIPCEVIYNNCGVIDTQYRLLAELARHFGKRIPMTGWPTDQVFTEFKGAVDSKKRVVVIILDEVDKLIKKGDDVLYNLSRINSMFENAKVSLIGISNDLKFTEFLDPRVRSSLGEEELIFPPYNADQLADVLQQRADMAFQSGVIDKDVISLCAALAARENGDARRALDLLRISAELAERERVHGVQEIHVRRAQSKIEFDRVAEVIKTLPTQSKLVLYSIMVLDKAPELIRRSGRRIMSTGEVYQIYRRMCGMIDIDVLTQRRITELISELDMLGIVNAIVVNRGRYGVTKEITLDTPQDNIYHVLSDDLRLQSIMDMRPDSIQMQLG
ncbi:MAG: ORC1-type DNA replication protein [Candidatus Methanogaster sp.]|nr:MAG: ORC1-type DNA replication protein [ANME-2 cluster archaeon]